MRNELLTPLRPMLGVLIRTKARIIRNTLIQMVEHGPFRLLAGLALLVVVWIGLYSLFWLVFDQFQRTPLEATVAIPLMFNFFFVAIFAMLILSNAIIAYNALFARKESVYLLTVPVSRLDFVTIKFLESLVLSSWSLVLLGLPLMLVMADRGEGPIFYVLFTAFFLAFIPIPGALGMLLAWAVAMFFPRRALRFLVGAVCVAATAGLVLGYQRFRIPDVAGDAWLREYLARMSFVESVMLPNRWVATGIDRALQRNFAESALYLAVTAANALFFSWLCVTVVSSKFQRAMDRASTGSSRLRRSASAPDGGAAAALFLYLPTPLRLIAAKDLRTFIRDPLQWSQLVILFGLLALYLTNMPTMRMHFSHPGWYLFIPFLNLCAVSLILATFTCRFVFPLPSLEGRTLWLLGLLPMKLGDLLIAKFAFAMTVTMAVGLGAMTLAGWMLEISTMWIAAHLAVTAAVCMGLCGMAIGIGARIPMLNETNVARIANGVGGTINLLSSIAMTAVTLLVVGIATWRSRAIPSGDPPDPVSLMLCGAACLFACIAGILALRMGAKNFNRIAA